MKKIATLILVLIGFLQSLAVNSTTFQAINNVNGALEVFARGTDNAIWHTWFFNSYPYAFSPQYSFGGKAISNVAVARNADGRVEIFYVGADKAVWHQWQLTPGGSWSFPSSLGGGLQGDPIVEINNDGRLEVFAVGTDGYLNHQWQRSPGGAWSGWYGMGVGPVSDPVVKKNGDGLLEVFAHTYNIFSGTSDAVVHIYQNPQKSCYLWNGGYDDNGKYIGLWKCDGVVANGWSNWNQVLNVFTKGKISITTQDNGNLRLYFRGTDNHLYSNTQSQKSTNNWNGTQFLAWGILSGDPAAVHFDSHDEVYFVGADWKNYYMIEGVTWSNVKELSGYYSRSNSWVNVAWRHDSSELKYSPTTNDISIIKTPGSGLWVFQRYITGELIVKAGISSIYDYYSTFYVNLGGSFK